MFRRALATAALAALLTSPVAAGPSEPAAPPIEASPGPEALKRALELRASGDAAGALALLEARLEEDATDLRARYLLAVLLLEAGRSGEGLEALLQTLERDPSFPEARASLAGAVQARVYELADRGQCDEAAAVLSRLAPRLEDEATALFLQGAIELERWRRTGDGETRTRALELWGRSRDLKPVSAVSELLAGMAAFEGRDYARARERFQFALQIRERNRYARLWLGLAQAAQGQFAEALQTLEGCQATFGANPAFHRILGDVHFARAVAGGTPDAAELDRAEACYRQARELWPGDPRLLAGLGELLRLRERWDEATACYAEALGLRREAGLALRAGALYQEIGRTEEALACFRTALEASTATSGTGERRRQEARAAVEAALCLLERGDEAGARAITSERTAALPRTDARLLLLRGALGSTEEREAALRLALQDEGPGAGATHLQAWLLLGRLEEERSRRVPALRCYAEALRLAAPGTPRAGELRARFEAVRQAELDDIAAWEANNGLVFLVDAVTGGSRSGNLQERKKALEELQPAEAGSGRRPGTVPPLAWPAELEGDLGGQVRAAGVRQGVDTPRGWLEQ